MVDSLLDQLQISKTIAQYTLLTDLAYQEIIYDWNQTKQIFPEDQTLQQCFEASVAQYPDNIALVYQKQSLTYRALNEQVNQLAHFIREQYQSQLGEPIGPDTLIAFCCERSLNIVIFILAILKAGAAYVPLDPSYPPERLQYILDDTDVKYILTQSDLSDLPGFAQRHLICIDDPKINWVALSEENPSHINRSTDLAYIIYTSGSTGKPKGVMIEHHSVVNLSQNIISSHALSERSICTQYANYIFDASVYEIFPTLFSGGQLHVLASEIQSDIVLLTDYIYTNQVTKLFLPTAVFKQIDHGFKGSALELIHTGGEALDGLTVLPEPRLINQYGPTESTVCISQSEVTTLDDINIGKPIGNITCYVLSNNLMPLPVGVVGELYIGGAGLARGYLNQPDLTAECFIQSPFIKDQRLYKTGDLVKWRADGNLIYIGREDFQVKVRGFRIELGEIESSLLDIEAITQVVVLMRARQDNVANQQRLVAYYLSSIRLDERDLVKFLSKQLPDYMIPNAFVRMEHFPVTLSGKIDTRALPYPEQGNPVIDKNAATTTQEQQLCAIWQELLGIKKIGVTEDFFRIGGDSILSMQLVARMRQAGFNCEVKNIFEYRTIRQLSQYCCQNDRQVMRLSEQGVLSGAFSLLPIQSWFFEQVSAGLFQDYHHWNQSFLVKVSALDLQKLEHCMMLLLERHDVLSLCFSDSEQHYSSTRPVPDIKQLDVSSMDEARLSATLTDWQSQFNLAKPPLWQMGYLHGYSDGSARIWFAFHHLIVDAVSWRILIQDLHDLYHDKVLPTKGTSYRQWVDIIEAYAQEHSEQQEYWLSIHQKTSKYTALISSETSVQRDQVVIDEERTVKLLQSANQAYHTEINDLLLTAFAMALHQLTGDARQGFMLEGHGRESIDERIDLSQTVGWFTTLYPVAVSVSDSLGDSIKTIKEQLRCIPDKGIGYGALRYHLGGLLSGQALPPISFNYLGQFDANDDFWQLTLERSGQNMGARNIDANILSVNSMVIDHQLCFHVDSKLSDRDRKLFLSAFEEAVDRVITHCVKRVSQGLLSYTASDFPQTEISSSLLDRLQTRYDIEDIYPANSLQYGFIYHVLTQPTDTAYRIQLSFTYRVSLNTTAFRRAWQYAIQKYPILRKCFSWEEHVLQVTCKTADLNWVEYDISGDFKNESVVADISQAHLNEAFDLSEPGLFRLALIRVSADEYTLMVTMHHSIADGWSYGVLLNYIHQTYHQIVQNESIDLTADQAYLSAQAYCAAHCGEDIAYWKNKLDSVTVANDISTLLTHSVDLAAFKSIAQPQEASLFIDGLVHQQIKALCESEGVTINVLLQFVWHKLLQTYTRDQETIVGTTIAGRSLPIEGIEESVGLYINTLPLVVNWQEGMTIGQQLHAIHQSIMELNQYSYTHLESLQHDGQRLFHSLLIFENYPIDQYQSQQPDQLKAELVGAVQKLDYPLSIIAYDGQGGLKINLAYAAELLSEQQAKRLLSQMYFIFEQIGREAQSKCSEIRLVPEAEYQKIVYDFNNTECQYSDSSTIHQLFGAQASRTPDAIALVFNDVELSYKVFDEKSNQLARQIRFEYQEVAQEEMPPDTMIAIAVERGIDMMIGLMAILKAGGAYVPLDPNYPAERISYILQDSGSQLLLTQCSLAQVLCQGRGVKSILLDTSVYDHQPNTSLGQYSGPDNLAYVLYTSGTTGKPKGVMLAHNAVINRLEWMQREYILEAENAVLQKTPYVFDVSAWELFWANWIGARIILARPEGHKESQYLYDLIEGQSVTVVHFVPSMLNVFIDYLVGSDRKMPCSIQYIFCSGEALTNHHMKKLSQVLYPYQQVHNQYGPTESGEVICTQCKVDDVSIGRPISNSKAYVLDSAGQVVPVGVLGELFLAGACLARGYVERPELTKLRFQENIFASEADIQKGYTRLYETGDLVRWLPNGHLEYFGRDDFQVKIRGFRIELSEIESVLLTYSAIKEVRVLAVDRENSVGQDKYLVTYFIRQKSMEILDKADLRQFLKSLLPEYMVPDVFIEIDHMPTNVNGKLDIRALPKPSIDQGDDIDAPKTATEIRLAAIWSDVLALDHCLAASSSFFDLGGSSLSAMIVLGKINTEFGTDLALKDLLENFTIHHIAGKIDQGGQIEWSPLIPVNVQDEAKPKLYVLPGIIGCSSAYYPLANLLSVEFSTKILEARGLYGDEKPHTCLDDILEAYFAAIQEDLQYAQPVYLVAHSFGCTYACELSIKLRQMGCAVKIVLIDGILKASKDRLDFVGTNDTDALLLTAIKELYALSPLENTFDHADSSIVEQIGDYLFADKSIDKAYKCKVAQGFCNVFSAQIDIGVDYKPCNRYLGDALYIVADDNNRREECLDSFQKKFDGKILVDASPGGHLTMLNKDNVAALAKTVLRYISISA